MRMFLFSQDLRKRFLWIFAVSLKSKYAKRDKIMTHSSVLVQSWSNMIQNKAYYPFYHNIKEHR